MKQKIAATFMSIIIVLSLGMNVSASNLRASLLIFDYYAWLTNNGNTITVNYYIDATGISDKVGVSGIDIKRVSANGDTTVATYGSSYGLNCGSHDGTVTYTGSSGYTYYAIVTFYVKEGNQSDSKTFTTNSITL
jgi:hypothetical protein